MFMQIPDQPGTAGGQWETFYTANCDGSPSNTIGLGRLSDQDCVPVGVNVNGITIRAQWIEYVPATTNTAAANTAAATTTSGTLGDCLADLKVERVQFKAGVDTSMVVDHAGVEIGDKLKMSMAYGNTAAAQGDKSPGADLDHPVVSVNVKWAQDKCIVSSTTNLTPEFGGMKTCFSAVTTNCRRNQLETDEQYAERMRLNGC
jgi:hypothetical protein